MTIGDKLVLFRAQYGLTQKDLAEAFDSSGKTDGACVSRWETGKVTPSRFTAQALGDYMAKVDKDQTVGRS